MDWRFLSIRRVMAWVYYFYYMRQASPRIQDEYWRRRHPSPDSYVGKLTALHNWIRIVKPEAVCELGVMHGFSTYAILKALEEVGKGTLSSIDRNEKCPTGQQVGHLASENLKRGRWTLVKGEFQDALPTVGNFDFIVEDVGYGDVWGNLNTAWKSLKQDGYLFVSSRTSHPDYDRFAQSVGGMVCSCARRQFQDWELGDTGEGCW